MTPSSLPNSLLHARTQHFKQFSAWEKRTKLFELLRSSNCLVGSWRERRNLGEPKKEDSNRSKENKLRRLRSRSSLNSSFSDKKPYLKSFKTGNKWKSWRRNAMLISMTLKVQRFWLKSCKKQMLEDNSKSWLLRKRNPCAWNFLNTFASKRSKIRTIITSIESCNGLRRPSRDANKIFRLELRAFACKTSTRQNLLWWRPPKKNSQSSSNFRTWRWG